MLESVCSDAHDVQESHVLLQKIFKKLNPGSSQDLSSGKSSLHLLAEVIS